MEINELKKRLENICDGEVNVELLKEVAIGDEATMYVIHWSVSDNNNISSFIVYKDGTLFHQRDWQGWHPETLEEIEECEWMSESGRDAIILNGLPRII